MPGRPSRDAGNVTSSALPRIAGRRVGVLYIIGTLAGIASVTALSGVASSDDALGAIAESSTGLSIAVVAVLAMGLALAMIPVIAYPVLRPHAPALARGYLVFRSGLEAVGYVIIATGWLLLLPISASLSGGADVTPLVPLADALVSAEGIGAVGTVVFVIGAAMFYTILWRARLVPRWISGWGLVGLVPFIVGAFLVIFGAVGGDSPVLTGLDIPLAIQEMVLAVYLIARGFREVPAPATPEERR